MIKKVIYLVAACVIASFSKVSAQKSDDIKAKEALNTVWLTLQCASGCSYSKPLDYIRDSTSRIIGQYILSPSDNGKLTRIGLNWKGNSIPSAQAGRDAIVLYWNAQEQISRMSAKSIDGFDYLISYNEQGIPDSVISRQLPNKLLKGWYTLEFDGQRLSKVISASKEINKKPVWTHSIITFSYNPDETKVKEILYAYHKPATIKNIADSSFANYRKINSNTFLVQLKFVTNEYTYNDDNALASKTVTKGKSKEIHNYKYSNGKIFREESLISGINNEFISKEIQIYFTLADQPESMPDWEKREGFYRFNNQGELIYEARDQKYREKVNGIWSLWNFFKM